MSPVKLFLAFVPWVIYAVVVGVAGPAGVPWAALFSLAAVIGLGVVSLVRRQSLKLLVVTSGVVFALYCAVGFAVPGSQVFLAGYGRGLAAIVLALVIFASLPVLPFSEQFAREAVPRQFWASPAFRAVNLRISAAWGVALGAVGGCNLVATALSEQVGTAFDVVLRFVLPVLFLLGALRYTQHVAAAAHEPHAA